jgi:DNA repair protein RadD
MVYKEWVCLFHEGFAGKKGQSWWSRRGGAPVPGIEDALREAEKMERPARIRVRKNDKHFEVLDYEFGPPRQAELAIGA